MLSGALLLLAGCRSNSNIVKTLPQGKNAIPLTDLTIENRQFDKKSELIFTLDSVFKSVLPCPQDLLLLNLKNYPNVLLVCNNDSSYVAKWNLYAAQKIFSQENFDRKKERKLFIEKTFGKASSAMEQYFRILERQIFSAGATSAIGTPSYPTAMEICRDGFLDELEKCLNQAMIIADTLQAQKAVQNELLIFAEYRQNLLNDVDKNIKRAYANNSQKSEFSSLYGDKSDLKTTLELKSNEQYLILTLVADEPADKSKKISQVRPRDYASMWAEDGFEIFLVPNPEKANDGWQFIVNSRGSLWDARHEKVGSCDVSWNAENAKVDFAELEGAWQITLSIPWSDLGFDKIPQKPFLANVYRNHAVKGLPRKSYAWSPIYTGAYYQVQKFGFFIWDKVEK